MFHTAAIIGEDGDMRSLPPRQRRRDAHRVWRSRVPRACANSCSSLRSWCTASTIRPSSPKTVHFAAKDNPYCETKLESDRLALGLHAPGAFDVTVIRAGDVYGARSRPWVLRPLDLMRKRIFFLIDGGRGTMNHVHVDNLLDGVFAALDRRASGEAFNVTDGAHTTFADYFGVSRACSEENGCPRRRARSCGAGFRWPVEPGRGSGSRFR